MGSEAKAGVVVWWAHSSSPPLSAAGGCISAFTTGDTVASRKVYGNLAGSHVLHAIAARKKYQC